MRREKGDGSIKEISPGKWRARIRINGKEITRYGKTKSETSKKLNEVKKKSVWGRPTLLG
jgi:hypothetical protein